MDIHDMELPILLAFVREPARADAAPPWTLHIRAGYAVEADIVASAPVALSGRAIQLSNFSNDLVRRSWERHAPAWLLEPGWSPAFPGEA